MSLSIIKELTNNSELQEQVNHAAKSINECLMENDTKVNLGTTIIAAYTLYKARISTAPFSVTYQDILAGKLHIREDILEAVRDIIKEETWTRLSTLLPKYAPDILAAVAFLPEREPIYSSVWATPPSIVRLVQALLQCSRGDRVADIGCGTGSFLISTALKVPDAHYSGYEINVGGFNVARIRAELLNGDIQVYLQDAFTIPDGKKNEEKFDKVFSNYPFGLRIRNLGGGAIYLKRLEEKYPGISKATSSDWIFNALLCDILRDTGKAIGIMTNGSTWNSIDMPMRKHFVESGMVECVISMPGRMFGLTNIPTSLILFSHGNHSVRLIDASNICQHRRRQNEFSEEDIQTIVGAQSIDSAYSKSIEITQLRENEYTLSLSRYRMIGTPIENGVPFEEMIKHITRGASCTAQQLDEMASDRITNAQYLMLANIQDGIIGDRLPYLTAIEPKYDKYCLKNNDLILSKNGYPYKVAVASIREGQKILANGNLYIIELNEERVNPYYLKAFFESEQGVAALKSISVGAAIPNIGVDKLKKLIIPLPSMEEQNLIAQKYQAVLDEIAVLKLKLEKAVSRLHHVFDVESEG